jgi:hypothetical protein
MKSYVRHIITICILLSVAALAVSEPRDPSNPLNPIDQSESIARTGSDPYLLAIVGTVLVSVVGLVVWVVRGNKNTIDSMIQGAEKRAIADREGAEKRALEDRTMYREEQKLQRESHERNIDALVDKLEGVANGQSRLEREVHALRNKIEN